jgi:hypothetical protein
MPELTLKKPDWALIEQNILIGCIVSDEFVKTYGKIHNPNFVRSSGINKIINLCLKYYSEYSESPKTKIKALFESFQEREANTQEEIEEINLILQNINGKYESSENDFDPIFEYNRTVEYFRKCQIREASETAQELIEKGKFDEAEQALKGIKPIGQNTLIEEIKDTSILSTKFIREKLHKPRRLVRPWLNLSRLNMIYAPSGIGKTWLCLALAVGLTRHEWMDYEIGPWQIKSPSGVLYIDGEMPEWEMQERLKLLSHGLREDLKNPLYILSSNRIARELRKQLNLTNQEWRDSIYQYIAGNPKIKTVIFDNLSALTPGRDENNKNDWDMINQWLITLRHLGLAVIIVHHAGKNKKAQRGTSSHEDAMDVVISMTRSGGSQEDDIWISFIKARNLAPGSAVESFKMRLETKKDRIRWVETHDGSD